jgi:protein-tyrosine phosphatase
MTGPAESPPIARVGDERPSRDLVRRVEALLGAGEVVALPTETVYGLAARADHAAALGRLHELKGRDPATALTWAVASRDAVERFDALVPLARRLVERYWPGPLTLVLSGVPPGLERIARDGWTGLRLPAHRATQAFLERLPFPVVLTSANRSGEPPHTGAAAVAELFGDGLGLVVDGGEARLAEPSGVLRLGPGSFELLREGLLPVEDLRRVAGLRIGFVCTGNTCRSPMAEALARALLQRRLGTGADGELSDFGFEVFSMGVSAGPGSPASAHAVAVMQSRGSDLGAHRSSPALPDRLRALDRVFCMTGGHLEAVRAMLPPGAARHAALLDPEGHDVPDPIGGSRTDYERCAQRIQAAIELRAADWA